MIERSQNLHNKFEARTLRIEEFQKMLSGIEDIETRENIAANLQLANKLAIAIIAENPLETERVNGMLRIAELQSWIFVEQWRMWVITAAQNASNDDNYEHTPTWAVIPEWNVSEFAPDISEAQQRAA